MEDPVKNIVELLKRVGGIAGAFELGDGVNFENRIHAISDIVKESCG